jgi:superoxide reductase
MATVRLQIYVCKHCGNLVEVLRSAGGQLVCCGDEMTLLDENATDAAVEKHVPVVEKVAGGLKVSVGSVAHPMTEAHFIEWIEAISPDGWSYRQFLAPNEAPEAFFPIEDEEVVVREICNLHGMWKS